MRGRKVEVNATDGGWVGKFQAMGSPCEVLLDGGSRRNATEIARLVSTEAWRVEARLSRYIDGNVVDRINTANGRSVEVDEETANLLDFAATLFELSGGRFDITSGVLRRVWVFDGSDNIPEQCQVDAVLSLVGWGRIQWERPMLRLEPGMEVDLGGIGKEYAVDRCVSIASNESEYPALVNFGGDLAVTGQPVSRKAWSVAIESEDGSAGTRISLKRGALATSGDARRYLISNGTRYGHILDPVTGWPVTDAPISVTVAAGTCTQAGMLSTMAMLSGRKAEHFLDSEHVRYWCRREPT